MRELLILEALRQKIPELEQYIIDNKDEIERTDERLKKPKRGKVSKVDRSFRQKFCLHLIHQNCCKNTEAEIIEVLEDEHDISERRYRGIKENNIASKDTIFQIITEFENLTPKEKLLLTLFFLLPMFDDDDFWNDFLL